MTRPGAATWIGRMPAAVAASLLMVLVAASWAGMAGIARLAATEIDVVQVVFLRLVFGAVFLLPLLAGPGLLAGLLAALRTGRRRLHIGAASAQMVSMMCYFTGITLLPLAEATALSFTSPLFATIGAALILGELVRVRRWTATAIGFAGTLIVLQPWGVEIGTGAALMLASAAIFAGVTLSVKSLSSTESPVTIALHQVLVMIPLALVPALLVWRVPSWEVLGLTVAMGALGTLGHLALARAMSLADASAVLPFDYARLPFSALIGYAVFAEEPGLWVWVGATVIFAATVYIAHREARAAGRARAAAALAGTVSPVPPAAPFR